MGATRFFKYKIIKYNFIWFFFIKIWTFCCILKAEIKNIHHGLQLALELKISHLIVESDSKSASDLIYDTHVTSHHRLFFLIKNCRFFLFKFEQATLQPIFREVNGPADALANWGRRTSSSPNIILITCPLLVFDLCYCTKFWLVGF